MATNPPVVAIVDDDDPVRRALRRLVRSLSYQSADFPSGESFLDSLPDAAPACALVDLHMPGLSGLEVLRQLRARGLGVPVIIISGNAPSDLLDLCLQAGAAAYLPKPIERAQLDMTIQRVTTQQQ